VETSNLTRQLTTSAVPVRRLAPPWRRAAAWLAIALPYVAIVVVLMSPRDDLVLQRTDMRFQIELVSAVITGVLAAGAALAMTVPGHSRLICLLPIAPLGVWLASLGRSCVEDWISQGPDGLRLRSDWECLPPALVASIVPAIAMVVMLRRGAPLSPRVTVAMGALAVAALTNAGLQLYHADDASIMVLVWHLGSAVILSAVAGWAGRSVLRWPEAASPPRTVQ
jgi:hypothetical protein